MTIRAVFVADVPIRYRLSVFVFSSGGHVELEPSGGDYLEGTVVQLNAVPDAGWTFTRWEGALTGTTNPDSIVMDSDKMVLGVFSQISLVSDGNKEPNEFRLFQNYPNPFNAQTNISFSLCKPGNTTLQIFDVKGRELAKLVDQHLESGSYIFSFDASNLVSGVYIYKIISNNFVSVKKMIVMK